MRMQLYLNGELRHFEQPISIAALLDTLGMGGRRVAVEVGQVIVPKSRHDRHLLQDGDRVEIIQAMGGG
jgi:sulfur carrier protein